MKGNSCRVGIIGGGISGLIAAEMLEKNGYKNVAIFEKEERLGGKLHTIWYKGKSYELGSIFGLPSQFNLKKLIKRLEIKTEGPKLSRVNYNANGEKTMPIPKELLKDFIIEIERLPEVLNTYESLKLSYIKYVEDELMISFSSWCKLYDFKVLKIVYTHYFTMFGLGDINEVPALYVFKIVNYEHLMSFMKIPEFTTWKDGVSSIVRSLEEEISDIRLGQEVKDIRVLDNNKILIKTKFEYIEFDRIIITAPLEVFINSTIWDSQIVECLENIKYQTFNAYAFVAENIPKGCGCVLENLSENRRGHVIMWDSRWDNLKRDGMIIIYSYGFKDIRNNYSLDIIKSDLDKLGIKNPTLYQAKSWKHCPYVDTNSLKNGFYEKLHGVQGKNNIYLAGEIMSTLSMENCITYSMDLIERYF